MQIQNKTAIAYFRWRFDQTLHLKDFPDQLDVFDFAEKLLKLKIAADVPSSFEELIKVEERFKEKGIQIALPEEKSYPYKLRDGIERAPVLCYQGSLSVEAPFLTVVGSRKPSSDSLCWMRLELAQLLKQQKLVVVSGAARGVDQEAHDLALAYHVPTWAFLPCGMDHIYPDSFSRMKNMIISQGGAVISGFPPWVQMHKSFFHQRNRWMVALCDAVLVVEAQTGGGSLLSGRLAMGMGKNTGAIPVHPFSTWGLGNNNLIYDGATMMRDHKDLSSLLSTGSQRISQHKEQNVHGPDGGADRNCATFGDGLGADVQYPVR